MPTDVLGSPMRASGPLLRLSNPNIQLDGVVEYDPVSLITRPGVHAFPGFVSKVCSTTTLIRNLRPGPLISYDLTGDGHDCHVKAELSINHALDESALYVQIDQMVSRQPRGEKGSLLSNGFWNVFYTLEYVVDVRWVALRQVWGIDCEELPLGTLNGIGKRALVYFLTLTFETEKLQ